MRRGHEESFGPRIAGDFAQARKATGQHGELSVTRRGKEIARVLPARRPIDFSAHEALRRSMPYQEIPSEVLIREDRDSR